MNIIKILSIGKFTLAIYYTKSDCYKYSIIGDYGTVLEHESICYTSEAAEAVRPRVAVRRKGGNGG